MSRFTTKATSTKKVPDTKNFAGGEAYSQTLELELISILLTSFASDSFYRSSGDNFNRLNDLIQVCDKEFVARAIVYARREFGMRSITHVAAAELAKYISGLPWAKEFYNAIVYRPDDMSEIISYYQTYCAKPNGASKRGKVTIPNAMKSGFAMALGKMSAYSLAKYKGEGKSLKLVDIVNMVHPFPTIDNGFVTVNGMDYFNAISKTERDKLINGEVILDESGIITMNADKQRKYWNALAAGNAKEVYWKISALSALVLNLLSPPETWEVELTRVGQLAKSQEDKDKLKSAIWTKLLKEKKLKYLALLRNLRNIIEQAPDMVHEACAQLTDRDTIKQSLIFPFQYATAFEQINLLNGSPARTVLMALNKAVDISCQNVPKFDGETLVVLDDSGSMTERCNDKSTNTPAKIGALSARGRSGIHIRANLQ